MMIGYRCPVNSARVATSLGWKDESDLESLILGTNGHLEEAGRQHSEHPVTGREVAINVLKRFADTACVLEAHGWSAERIKQRLGPARRVFAESWFMQRCQEWPRGYAGDFETIEYMVSGANRSLPGTLGWHIENILLESPVVQQHRNKLKRQSLEIVEAVMRSRTARVLSIGCGGCMDFVPILPDLKSFAGEIVLNDHEPAALELAEQRLRPFTTTYRLIPGNVIRVSKRLAGGDCFDLILAGGLYDYLSDRAAVFLVNSIYQDLLAPGGVLLFTNMAEGNPWRLLMEYGSDWNLVERSEDRILEICRKAAIPRSSTTLTREATQLAVIARVVR